MFVRSILIIWLRNIARQPVVLLDFSIDVIDKM